MVNYLYDLKRLDKHRTQLAQGRVRCRKKSARCCWTEQHANK